MTPNDLKALRAIAVRVNPCEDCGSPGCVLAKAVLELTKDPQYRGDDESPSPNEGVFSHDMSAVGPAR